MWNCAITLILVFNFSAALLEEEYNACEDIAMYRCFTEVNMFQSWDIQQNSVPRYTWTSVHNTPVGVQYINMIGVSEIIAQVIANNGSHFNSMITITNVSSLINGIITCNGIKHEIVTIVSRDFLPSFILLLLEDYKITVSWNISADYDIHIMSWVRLYNMNYKTENTIVQFNLSNETVTLDTYVCNHFSTFFIGPCLFNNSMQNVLTNNYMVFPNGTWELTCHNSNKTFVTNCFENGTWKNIECDDDYTDSDSTSGNSLNSTETDDHIKFSSNTNILALIISTLASFIILSAVIIGLLLFIISYCKRKRKQRVCNLQSTSDTNESNYEQLTTHHNKRNKAELSLFNMQAVSVQNLPNGEYSTILRKNIPSSHNEEYSILPAVALNSESNKRKDLEYAEVHTCVQCGQIKPLLDCNVGYSNVNTNITEPDLSTLLQQLHPISENYSLFGSVAGISPTSLELIKSKDLPAHECLMKVCELWLKKCHDEQTPPTWHAVAEILDLIGYAQLSNDILQVYSTGKLPIEINSEIFLKDTECLPSSQVKEINEDIEKIFEDDEPPPIPSYNPNFSEENTFVQNQAGCLPIYEEVPVSKWTTSTS